MRRVVPLISVLLLLSSARAASAGGSWLDVTQGARVRTGNWDLAYAAVGGVVTMRGTFSTGQQAAVSEGPWYAYLRLVEGKSNPALLGDVGITGDGYPYVATVTFEVPSVRTGYYWVGVCDLGCKQGVGDLIGGTIVLAPTESEARLLAHGLILQWMHDADVRTIDELKKRQQVLQTALEEARDAARTADRRAGEAHERVADATRQAADGQALLEEAKRQRNIWRLGSALGLLGLLAGGAWAVSLRRRIRALVPDSPEALIADKARALTEQAHR